MEMETLLFVLGFCTDLENFSLFVIMELKQMNDFSVSILNNVFDIFANIYSSKDKR